MKTFQKGFSPIFLLIAAIIIIGGGAYLYTQGDLPFGGGWKQYTDPQSIFTIKVPSDLSTNVTIDTGGNTTINHIAGNTAGGGFSTGATIVLISDSRFQSLDSALMHQADHIEDISFAGTSGYFYTYHYDATKMHTPTNINNIDAMSGPIAPSNDRLEIEILNVKDGDVSKYSDLLKQIIATVSFK